MIALRVNPIQGGSVAIIRIQDASGVTREMYDAVSEKLDVENDPPDGMILHTASEVDGHMHIIDVWESEEAAERFGNERLGPTIAEVGRARGDAPPQPPAPTVHELHHLVRP